VALDLRVADLHEADRGSDDEFAPPGLLIAGRQGTVAQKIEQKLVLRDPVGVPSSCCTIASERIDP
jgi:hypothetical protein